MPKPQLLIIEDELMMQETYNDIFTEEGYQVSLASNGREGLDMIRENQYDAIILDIMMPVMDGLTLLNQLENENGQYDQTPFIVLTNVGPQTMSEIQDKYQKNEKVNIQQFIVKSQISPKELITAVATACASTSAKTPADNE